MACVTRICFCLILGKMRGPPSQLQEVCVGPPTSSAQQQQGQTNISWDPLPCHLQNGADIAKYIIWYTRLLNGTPRNISSSDRKCHQQAGDPYSCLADDSLFVTRPGETYSFQVAAQSTHGIGSFSNPVNFVFGSRGKHIVNYLGMLSLK